MLVLLDKRGNILGLGVKSGGLMFMLFDARGYPLPVSTGTVRSLFPVTGNLYISSCGELVVDVVGKIDFYHTGSVFSLGDTKIDYRLDGSIFDVGGTKMDDYWSRYGGCDVNFDYYNGKIYSVNGVRFDYCHDGKRLYSLGGVRIEYDHLGRLYSVGSERVSYRCDGTLYEV